MEYLKLDPPEQQHGKKQLLHAEMEILTMVQRANEFNRLRKVETELKTLLKKKIVEMSTAMEELDKILPKMHIEQVIEEKRAVSSYTKKRQDLEVEIEEIKQKLSLLGS